MRKVVTAFLRFCLRVFYRRIEFVGLERVPGGAVIFAVNHPNGLVDPLFLLCFAPRPVSFLAKAPLFHSPIIGWFVRAFETIPVFRRSDVAPGSSRAKGGLKPDPTLNRETFTRARDLLRRGGSIAIFPEGTTHSDPQLRELKTGAARIALGAGDALSVVPTGIYYTKKHAFRSSAAVVFGPPLRVEPATVDEEGEPPAEEVERLTAQIDEGLDAVTLQADSHAALELIARAEDLFTADDRQPLADELELRRRFIEGYHYLRARDPRRLQHLESSLAQFEAELLRLKIGVHELKPRVEARTLFRIFVLLPFAAVGILINYPAYRLVDWLARRYSKGEGALIATVKFLASLALYPLTYAALAIAIGWRQGIVWGVVSAVALPVVSYAALRVVEDIDDVIGDLRALRHRGTAQLAAQRERIRKELVSVAREMV
ncbi:MAG TPA: lysophospholipid acyltransferase family protein [Thermoanaerobaculia bacterium]|nr:lysophospholipid acyltransferase family protein [Thermoanaerobaculia bacterium]